MNIELGKMNRLRVVKAVDFGMYWMEAMRERFFCLRVMCRKVAAWETSWMSFCIWIAKNVWSLPRRHLWLKSEICLFAGRVGKQLGAFLDWGLMKDLFVPFREQKLKMQKGRSYIVHLHVDEESYRLMASAKVERYLSDEKGP